MLSRWGGALVQSAMTPGEVAPGPGAGLVADAGGGVGIGEAVVGRGAELGTEDGAADGVGAFTEAVEAALVVAGEPAAALEWLGPHPATAISSPRMAAVVSFVRAVRIPLLTREQPQWLG